MTTKTLRTGGIGGLFGVAVLLLSVPSQIRAQAIPSHGPPSEQHCRALANQLHADPHSEAFRRALGPIAACGAVGGEAIAAALRSSKAIQEAGFAGDFRFAVAYNRNPALLAALLEVAADPSATAVMRIVAIEGALRQHEIDSAFSRDLEEIAARPVGEDCDIVYVEDGGDYKSATPLPANSKASAVTSLRRVADDGATPATVRDAARCVAEHLGR